MRVACPHRRLTLPEWRLKIYAELFADVKPAAQASGCLSTARRRYSTTRSSFDPPSSKIRQVSSDNVTSTADQRPARPWSPYSASARDEMRRLADAFEAIPMSEKDADSPKPSRHIKWNPPSQSPIMKKPLNKRRPVKRRPNLNERALEADPWAQMLAEPIRMCNGTKVRLPVPLLTNWSFVKKPDSEHIYILPDSLADLDQLDELGKRALEQGELSKERHDVYRELKDDEDEGGGDETEEMPPDQPFDGITRSEEKTNPDTYVSSRKTREKSGNPPAIRVLASKQLMNILTRRFAYNPKPHDPHAEWKHKSGDAIMTLLPQKWKDRITRAQHFESNRREVERKTGMMTSGAKEMAIEASISAKNLRWQIAIEERLLDILRRRVVICVKRVVEISASSNRKMHQRMVSGVPAVVEVLRNKGVWPGVDKAVGKRVVDETPKSEAGIPSPNAPAPYERPRYIVGKAMLHFSPNSTGEELTNLPQFEPYGMRTTIPLNQPEDDAPIDTTEYLMPPLVAISAKAEDAAYRNPIFPLHAMLGDQRYGQLLEVLAPFDDVFDKQSDEQVLSIRAKADFGDVLFKELWRLWRYVGGRKCMQTAEATTS